MEHFLKFNSRESPPPLDAPLIYNLLSRRERLGCVKSGFGSGGNTIRDWCSSVGDQNSVLGSESLEQQLRIALFSRRCQLWQTKSRICRRKLRSPRRRPKGSISSLSAFSSFS